jgi:glucose-1-phosphate cytidylyltransferase
MEVVILAGGLGTRLSEETDIKPKPMVEVGGKPILWHIMKIYENYGFNNFTLALGYKGEVIKDYFMNYHSYSSDLEVNLKNGEVSFSNQVSEDWNVSLINTGISSMTGGRLLRLKEKLKETFMLTYGDGVSDIDLQELLKFHKSHGKIATVTAVIPSARFGGMHVDDGRVLNFKEKPQSGSGWINGGFFIFEPSIFDYLDDDTTVLEREPMEKLVNDGELMAYQHHGYWQCMDTIRDRESLQEIWSSGDASWLGKK